MDKKTVLLGAGGVLIIAGVVGYSLFSYHRTLKNIRAADAGIQTELTNLKADFDAKYSDSNSRIADLEQRNDVLASLLVKQEAQGNSVAATIGKVSATVGVLEKLSKTDGELLKQYSKVYFLNEHYVPISLTNINPKYIYTVGKLLQMHSNVEPYLDNLLADAAASGVSLKVESAYRSFGSQAQLKSSYRVTYGAGTANSFSAEQGYSEHQLGTAVDFTTTALKGALAGFNNTVEYMWLQNNAYRYGFVISYPESNKSYVFEPWHWRFVGKALATYLHQNNQYFYSLDQRVIDAYLASIFD